MIDAREPVPRRAA